MPSFNEPGWVMRDKLPGRLGQIDDRAQLFIVGCIPVFLILVGIILGFAMWTGVPRKRKTAPPFAFD